MVVASPVWVEMLVLARAVTLTLDGQRLAELWFGMGGWAVTLMPGRTTHSGARRRCGLRASGEWACSRWLGWLRS